MDKRTEWEIFRGDNLIIVSGQLVTDAFNIANKTITELKQKGKIITKVDFMDMSNSEHRTNFKTVDQDTGVAIYADTTGWSHPIHAFLVKIEYERKSYKPLIQTVIASGTSIIASVGIVLGLNL
ncbi:MAG: hypothetical protein EB829_03125 [Nitrosopumilus sp. H8]|nr:MAG: hypothetical protein EB829_03125 [Nitrosopumilus sp. H8]